MVIEHSSPQLYHLIHQLISNKNVVERLKVSTVTANELVRRFVEIGILREITGKKRYIFTDYVEIIARGTKNELRGD